MWIQREPHYVREDWQRLAQGYGRECHEAMQILASALGYRRGETNRQEPVVGRSASAERLPDGPQGNDYATGEHTVVTLAMEAARRIPAQPETCTVCGEEIELMCYGSTEFCSQNCERGEPVREPRVSITRLGEVLPMYVSAEPPEEAR